MANEGEGAPGATATGGQSGQQGQQGGTEKTYTGTDLSAKYSEGYNGGVEKATKDLTADLKRRFGVEKLDEIEAMIAESKKGANPDHANQITKLSGQLAEQEAKHKAERLNWRLQAAMSGLDSHNPELAAAQILKHYDVQIDEDGRETITKRSTGELIVADGKPVTTKDLVQILVKDPDFAFMFKAGGSAGSTLPGQKKSKLNDDMLKDPAFVKALQMTDQYFAFINGKPVDEDAVLAAWKEA